MAADQQQKLGIVVYVEDQASGKLTKVKAEVAGLGQSGAIAGRGMATGAASIEKSAGRMGGALNHARGALGGLLTGPLGIIGLGAGVLTLGGAFETGLSKAQTWGLQIEKLQGITHDSAESLSGLLAVTEKYGLSNERLSQIAGFTEKALGNLTKGVDDQGHEVKGAAQFVKDYGFNIYDTHGKVKSFSQLLLSFSDYWVKDKNRTEAAAAAAKLFGRGYADLVPILNLGSKGIRDAEEEAKALGLTLTQDNIVALAKAREATRQWGDALGGLELQVGIALLPKLVDLAHWATSFVAGHGHEIVKFFSDAADFAGQAAGTIGDLAGAAGKFWGSIPAPMRDLLLKGLVADRTVHFLFGFSPLEAVGSSLLKGFTGSFFQRGTSPANPMWVQQVGGPLGAAGGLGGIGLLGALGIGAAIVGTGYLIGQGIYSWLGGHPVGDPAHDAAGTPIGGNGSIRLGMSQGEYYRSQAAKVANPYPGKALDDLAVAMPELNHSVGKAADDIVLSMGYAASVFARAPWLAKLEASWQRAGQTMHDKIKAAMDDIAAGRNVHGAATFLSQRFGRSGFGSGGYDQALAAIASLKGLHSSDPAVARAIARLTAELPRLKTDKADLAAAIKIAQSDEPKAKQLTDLNKIMDDLRRHGDPTSRKKLQDIIDAVKHKKLNVSVRVGGPTVNIALRTTVYDTTTRKAETFTLSTGRSTSGGADFRQTFARGGQPPISQPYWVGEDGPELRFDTRPGFILDAQRSKTYARSGGGLNTALEHVTNSTARSAIERNLERIAAHMAAMLQNPQPVLALASSRDFEASTARRSSHGGRSRQIGW